MNKAIPVALLVGGIVLLVIGALPFGSDVSRFFTGSPTDNEVGILIGGTAAAVAGLFGTLRGSK